MQPIRQAIETKSIAPTSHKGDRIVASCSAGRRYGGWDYALSASENHVLAASLLAVSLDWMSVERRDGKVFQPELVTGVIRNGNHVHVLIYSEVKENESKPE